MAFSEIFVVVSDLGTELFWFRVIGKRVKRGNIVDILSRPRYTVSRPTPTPEMNPYNPQGQPGYQPGPPQAVSNWRKS